jgi:hypothetical protein
VAGAAEVEAEASAGGAAGAAAVAEASAAGGVEAVDAAVEESAAGALVEASSAFFWQADRLRARAATAATEVMIRTFMDCSPGGLSPDNRTTLTRLREFPKS